MIEGAGFRVVAGPAVPAPPQVIAELAFALAWTRGIVGFDRAVRAGRWNPAQARLRRLATLTVRIVGYGRIGRATARKFSAFGCRVLVHSKRWNNSAATSPAQLWPTNAYKPTPPGKSY